MKTSFHISGSWSFCFPNKTEDVRVRVNVGWWNRILILTLNRNRRQIFLNHQIVKSESWDRKNEKKNGGRDGKAEEEQIEVNTCYKLRREHNKSLPWPHQRKYMFLYTEKPLPTYLSKTLQHALEIALHYSTKRLHLAGWFSSLILRKPLWDGL